MGRPQIRYLTHVEGMLPSLHDWKMLDALVKEANCCPVVLYQSDVLFANNLDCQAHNPAPNDAHFRAHKARSCLLAYSDLHVAERPFLYRQRGVRHFPVHPHP